MNKGLRLGKPVIVWSNGENQMGKTCLRSRLASLPASSWSNYGKRAGASQIGADKRG
ncbi:MAG: hypothetical protein RIE73_11100 [Coleofasciculus sp. C1-SOL-03]|uniref:hypothetical protein n=1 Tax=Coleofasciculus sp. C1-SOL-03 TaxID=3069522 RepID=UPI0032FECF63